MARKREHISILQFDSGLISRLRVKRGARPLELLSFDQQRGEWLESAALDAALEEFAQAQQLALDDVYVVLPRHEITARVLTLPSQERDEILNMIRLSADEYVPYSTDELEISAGILNKHDNGEALVLAALAHRDVVSRTMAHLDAAGIEAEKLYLTTSCIATAAAVAGRTLADNCAIVNMAAGGIEVAVFRHGQLTFNRGVASHDDWTTAAEAASVLGGPLEDLAGEVRTSLSAARRESEDGEDVETVYVISDYAPVEDARGVLERELGKPCFAGDALVSALVAGGASALHCPALAALGAAQAALGAPHADVNLLPESVAEARKLAGVKRLIKLGAAVAAVNLLVLGGLYTQMLWQRQSYLAELETQYLAIAPRAKGIEAKQDQLRIIRQQVDSSASVLEVLAKIAEAAPEENITITRVNYDHRFGTDLWGRANKNDDVQAFSNNLRGMASQQLQLFANAMTQYEDKGMERQVPVRNYHIQMANTEEDDSVSGPASAQ